MEKTKAPKREFIAPVFSNAGQNEDKLEDLLGFDPISQKSSHRSGGIPVIESEASELTDMSMDDDMDIVENNSTVMKPYLEQAEKRLSLGV